MKNSGCKSISDSDIKDHFEILQIIDEIREFENNFVDFKGETVEETENITQDLIEVDPEGIEEVVLDEEVLQESDKKFFKFLKEKEKKEPKPRVHTTFKMRFNEERKLVNLDFKQPKIKKKRSESKSKFNLKKFIPSRKKENEETSDKSESSSKASKLKGLKGGLGKLSKLKKVIPNKKSSSEESKEEK